MHYEQGTGIERGDEPRSSMLKVHRDSWHYRIWSLGRPSRHTPRNLCRYFWYIALLVLIGLTITALAIAGIVGLVYVVFTSPFESLIAVLMGAAIIVGIILLVGIGGYLVERHEKKKEDERIREDRVRMGLEEPQPPKEPGLIRSWLRAKKKKYCPLIEVVDHADKGPSAEVRKFWQQMDKQP